MRSIVADGEAHGDIPMLLLRVVMAAIARGVGLLVVIGFVVYVALWVTAALVCPCGYYASIGG